MTGKCDSAFVGTKGLTPSGPRCGRQRGAVDQIFCN